jgi:DNA-binding MarR family transcriptional regulator
MEGNIPSQEDIVEDMDAVDRIIEQWAEVRPGLDVSPIGVIGRLHRVAALLDTELRTVFAAAGLGNGDFDVLATLRRAGEPYELTPSELSASTMVTSGAVTKRLDRLEGAGLVSRTVSRHDARGRVVRLTAEGLRLVDVTMERHVANEDRLLHPLDAGEREQLAGLLSRLLVGLEGEEVTGA